MSISVLSLLLCSGPNSYRAVLNRSDENIYAMFSAMATASRVCEAFILYFQLSWVSLYLPKEMYHLLRMDCSLAQYGSSHSTVKVRFSSVR